MEKHNLKYEIEATKGMVGNLEANIHTLSEERGFFESKLLQAEDYIATLESSLHESKSQTVSNGRTAELEQKYKEIEAVLQQTIEKEHGYINAINSLQVDLQTTNQYLHSAQQ
jgi:chromosome segregation ATPase